MVVSVGTGLWRGRRIYHVDDGVEAVEVCLV